jgi:hypothetical protein
MSSDPEGRCSGRHGWDLGKECGAESAELWPLGRTSTSGELEFPAVCRAVVRKTRRIQESRGWLVASQSSVTAELDVSAIGMCRGLLSPAQNGESGRSSTGLLGRRWKRIRCCKFGIARKVSVLYQFKNTV